LGGCGVKVNELLLSALKTNGTSSPNDEWVELHNTCSTGIDLHGYSLRYRSKDDNNGSADTVLVDDIATTIKASGYLLYRGSGYPINLQHDGDLQGQMADSAGGVAIIHVKSGAIIDSVCWGHVVSTHKFLEGTAAPAPPETTIPGTTLAREPDGADTDNNSVDFQITTDVTPEQPNL
jgi:hypothetical protein